MKIRKDKGFTLLELAVAIGVFALLIIIVSSLFTRLVFVQRRDTGQQTLQEDIRFVFESFNREARTGYASTFALSDTTGTSFVFRNQNGQCVNYRLNTTTARIERGEVTAAGTTCLGVNFTGGYAPLTSNRIDVQEVRFDIPDDVYDPANDTLTRQGFVTFMIQAKPENTPGAPINVQSSVSSRQVLPYSES